MLGLQDFYLGCVAQVLYDYTGARHGAGCGSFPTTGPSLTAVRAFLLGIALAVAARRRLRARGAALLERARRGQNHLAVLGLALVILGFRSFAFTLLLQRVVATSAGRTRA